MILFLLNNLLLGDMPETLGLLLFGVALIAITVSLRWALNKGEQNDLGKEGFEKLTGKTSK